MADYLIDDIFFCVFHCNNHRHDISWVVEGLKMNDFSYVLMLSDEVTDCVNVFYISPLDVGYFKGSSSPGTILIGARFPL